MNISKHASLRILRRATFTALAVALSGVAYLPAVVLAATPPSLTISQTPLTVTSPVHPQVIFAIGNSQSMDGDLSGAIMTGSGTVTGLSGSSSPVNYTVPSGYTPPSNTANADLTLALPSTCPDVPAATSSVGDEPYTTTCGTTEYDTSASRLNVAKEGMLAIMNQYFPTTDFALEDYSTSGNSLYTTWVYYMSNNSGFSFTNTQPASGTDYVTNPCWNYSSSSSSTVKSNCSSISSTLYSSSTVGNSQYMVIGASSDDADINDVLYSSGNSPVYIDYGTVTPTNPYPPNKSLADYESGSISVSYSKVVPSGNGTSTGPTNAGYVPYSTQVMYAQRGFGYYVKSMSHTTGNNVVAMTSAGTSPTAASVTTAMGKFAKYLAPETNSTSSSEIKALAYQSPLPALLAGASSTLKTSLAAASADCTPPKQYVVLVTDGLPTMDSSGNNWPPLGSASAAGYGVTAAYNADGSLNTTAGGGTNDQAMIDTISQIQTLQNNGIETYVIGLGAGVSDPSSAAGLAMKAMAVAGGTSSTSADGYFPASSTADLVQDLSAILSNISSQNTSSSSAAANSTSLTNNSYIYQATFNPGSATSNAWTGDLQEYGINANAVINTTATWSAQAQLDALASPATTRNIATWDPYHVASGGTTATPAAVGFDWNTLSSTLQGDLQPSDTNGQLRLNYLRGDHSEEQSNSGGIFRTREHLLGDIVDSSPAYVGAPSDYFPDASYQTFATNNASRTPILYVGANDGMLHGFNASTGNEVMAFIPYGVFANLYQLTSPYYLYNHHFYVDGTPYVDDAMLSDGNWHTLLVGGENAGGNSIYAIDVTNPSGYTSDSAVASDVLWEFTDSDMGYSYSAPVIVRSNAVSVTDASDSQVTQGFAVIFGNGYNSPSGQPIFYAVDASTGQQIAKINLCTAAGVPTTACSSSAANGLSSVTATNSSGLVGVPQDMVYAGDLQGNLWAINIGNADPTKWTVKLLFQARDSSNNAQPITSAPSVTPNPNFPGMNGQSYLGSMVYFGTGMFLQTTDLTSTSTQSFYGVWDNTSDLSNYPTGQVPSPPYKRSNLQSQTISLGSYTVGGVSTPAIFSTSNEVNLTYNSITYANPTPPPASLTANPVEGWYFDLSPLVSSTSAPAPRVFNASAVESGGVLFAVNIPPDATSTSCGTPSSYLMYVQYDSGTPFPEAAIGFGGGVTIVPGVASGAGSRLTNSNPTGIFIGNGYSSAATSMGNNGNTNSQIISGGAPLPGSPLPPPPPTKGDKSGRLGWWQVQ
ncbi:pilus assembly protein [Rhodanobacter sp. Si-c]|uniref:Pilus assembly protein n=1 Tax=Rhodanobacter lycopersici TaxID=3162487 RepID=A0ABV3QHF5_9GAMM